MNGYLRSTSDGACDKPTRCLPIMDPWERQQVFREMVVSLLKNGPLSGRRRRQVVQYAAALDINAVLAGRLINQARKLLEQQIAEPSPQIRIVSPAPHARTIPRIVKVVALAGTLAVVTTALLAMLN